MTLDTTKAKALAHTLRARLGNLDIAIRHTRALDLVCASYGLRNRSLLGTTALTPASSPDLAKIDEVARSLARHDDGRRATIVQATAAVTHPAGLTIDLPASRRTRGGSDSIEIPMAALEQPYEYLKEAAARPLIDALAAGCSYYRYFDSSNSGIEKAICNDIAKAMIEAIDGDDSPLHALETYFQHGEEPEAYIRNVEGTSAIESFVEELREAAEEQAPGTEINTDDWEQALVEAVATAIDEDDESTALDLIGKNDRAEVVFMFGAYGGTEDDMVTSAKPWADPAEMVIDDRLQFVLSQLGYTLTEYRKLSGNQRKAADPKTLFHGRPKRPKVVEWKHVASIIREACNRQFNVVLYGYVPLRDLATLRKDEPQTLVDFRLASYDPWNGTFHDSGKVDEIVVTKDDGSLRSCAGWYTPDGICSLVLSHYNANVRGADAARTFRYDASGVGTGHIPIQVTPRDMASPPAFLGLANATTIIRTISRSYGYRRHEPGVDLSRNLRRANEIATAILDAGPEDDPRDTILEDALGYATERPRDAIARHGAGPIESLLRQIETFARSMGTLEEGADLSDWADATIDAVAEDMAEIDDSNPEDVLTDGSDAEVMFVLGAGGAIDDVLLHSTGGVTEPGNLAVDANLKHVLSQLGYTVDEFRTLSGNGNPAHPDLDATGMQAPRRPKVIGWTDLERLVCETPSWVFNVVLYGIVPIKDMVRFDSDDAVTLEGFRVATYNCETGNFAHGEQVARIDVGPSDGRFASVSRWRSPAADCALDPGLFRARILRT